MSSNQTTNYGLHQWQPTDDFLREEFNENFGKLDTALGGLFVLGTYTGNGRENQRIELGRKPRLVLLNLGGINFSGSPHAVYSGFFSEGYPLGGSGNNHAYVTDTGFSVGSMSSNNHTNESGQEFYYIAFL